MFHIRKIQSIPVIFLFLMLVFFLLAEIFSISFSSWGLYPLRVSGIFGVFMAPLIHADSSHFFSNFSVLIILFILLFTAFRQVCYFVFICSYIIPGIITWFIGRNSYHIGASGMVYALISFMLLIGFFSKKREILAISFIVLLLHGGFIWGMLPIQNGVSWEYHVGGFITGISLALFFRNFPFDKMPEKVNNQDSSAINSTAQGIEFIYENKK